MPKTSVTPCATSVSTKASLADMRGIGFPPIEIGFVGHARTCFSAAALSIARRQDRGAAPTRQWRLLSNGSGKVNLSCTDYKNALRAKKAWTEEETNE